VKNVYVQWIEQMAKTFPDLPVMVFTVPWYLGYENYLEQEILKTAKEV